MNIEILHVNVYRARYGADTVLLETNFDEWIPADAGEKVSLQLRAPRFKGHEWAKEVLGAPEAIITVYDHNVNVVDLSKNDV